ncbi:MAG TPA: aspartate carbamoyltransferase [Bacteroidota bacterium]|nr:aspartate carbamoyltransferase [Bacteroidota bacterium]
MKLDHIIEAQQFNVPMIMELFNLANEMERVFLRGGTQDYHHKIMASLFYEPSTRTRLSFETAMCRLGGRIISTENAKEFSSVTSGESLEDTIRVLNEYVDVIVLRSNTVGGAKRAASVSQIPIINAGDGKGGQHPTQALLDLYTIHKEINTINGLNIAISGDLELGRTARSLTYLLGKFDRVRIFFVAPEKIQMSDDILSYLDKRNVWYTKVKNIEEILPEVDVVYQTRIDKSRIADLPDADEIIRKQFITKDHLSKMKSNAIIMHPLPRMNEISTDVDTDRRAAYFRQARNGIYIRMALLVSVLS